MPVFLLGFFPVKGLCPRYRFRFGSFRLHRNAADRLGFRQPAGFCRRFSGRMLLRHGLVPIDEARKRTLADNHAFFSDRKRKTSLSLNPKSFSVVICSANRSNFRDFPVALLASMKSFKSVSIFSIPLVKHSQNQPKIDILRHYISQNEAYYTTK